MKLIHRLSLFVVAILVTVPLVIMAQDQPTPSGNDDDLFVPLPTGNTTDDDLFMPLPTAGSDDDLFIPLPDDTCGNDDPNTIFVPLCPPTVMPTATYTMIPSMTPRPTTQPAPDVVNGLWVLDPKNDFSSTGQCQSANYHIVDGGPDHNFSGEEEQPTIPVCMSSDQQWLSVDTIGTFPLTVPPFYSQQQMRRELLSTNGKTTGSMNVTYTRQYNVISPTEIEYSYIYSEAGGCTTKNIFHYKLKEANDLVCTGTLMTVMPTFTPVSTITPTAAPGETQQPPVTPVPPIKEGRYVITVPPVDSTCTSDKMPQSNAVDLTYDNNQNLFINFGGSSYTLYWDGENFYQYREGNQFSINVYIGSNGAMFSWKKQGCFVDSPFTQEGAPTPTPIPVEPTSESNTNTGAIAGSTFTTTATTQEAYCATENQSLLPDLNTAVLTAKSDNSFVLSVGGQDYSLTNKDGYFIFSQVNADGSMLTISMNGLYEGVGSGSYTVIGVGNKMCTALLTFTPAG